LKLVAKFDLVVVDPDGKAMIFDWKTEKKLPTRTYLDKAPQTVVYRYMLCAAGGQYSPRGRFKPEEISMVYWNPMYPGGGTGWSTLRPGSSRTKPGFRAGSARS
jgi:hypothetical protein